MSNPVRSALGSSLALLSLGLSPPASAQQVLKYFTGADDDAYLGGEVAKAGDLDLDGRSDALVTGRKLGGLPFVRAYSGYDGAVLFEVLGDSPDELAYALDVVGDLDGDGRAEFIVGYRHDGTLLTWHGSASVHSGADGARLYQYLGVNSEDRLGYDVAGVGDVDADGCPDFAIGILWRSEHHYQAGAAEVYSGRDGRLLHHFDGREEFSFYGSGVSAAGDLDLDGHADVLVSGYGNSSGVFHSGCARVHSGRTGEVLIALEGEATYIRLGQEAEGGHDVDGDGVPDLLLLATRGYRFMEARVHSGANGALIRSFTEPEVGGPKFLAFAGDVDGDGLADFALGGAPTSPVRILAGRDASVLLELEGARAAAGMGRFDGDALGDVLFGFPYTEGGAGGAAAIYSLGPCSVQQACATSPNSVGFGAVLVGSGSTSLAQEDFHLSAHFCPPGELGLFVYSDTPAQVPFGDGLRCVSPAGGGIRRLEPAIAIDAGGVALLALDFDAPPLGAGPGEVRPVVPVWFQFWYRDPSGPGGSGFNLSDALRVVFCP